MRSIVLAMLTTACVGRGGKPTEAPGEPARELGLLSFTYQAAGESGRIDVLATFARAADVDAPSARRLLGLPDESWTDGMAPDTCRAIDLTGEMDGLLADGSGAIVELLDAGALSLTTPVGETLLLPHTVALPFASGVVYGEAIDGPLDPGEHAVEGDGGGDVAPFLARITPPEPLRVSVSASAAGDLDVRWDPPGDGSDLLTIELSWARGGHAYAVRCLARDDARFALPASLWRGAIGATAPTVTAARVRRSSFGPGSEIRFAVRDAVALPEVRH